MIYELLAFDSVKLLSLPETGMGYQVIRAKLNRSGIEKRYVVYNEELIVDLDTEFNNNKRAIISKGFSRVLREAPHIELDRNSISLIPRNLITETRFMSETKRNSNHRYSGGKSAVESPKENAPGYETFVRVSAYEDDKRIDFTNKSLKEGTYTTTHKDYTDCVKDNDNPIDRYALPNDEIIKWAFYVLPSPKDILQRGIVQPAFGHDGGGIEVYFEKGTSNNTVLSGKEYGK